MKNDDLNTRGTRLRDERKRLGIQTQEELAEILGVKKNSIGRFEKHNEPLNTDYLDKLEAHGFNIHFILWGEQPVKSGELSEAEVKLIELYRQTREEMRGGLVSLIETYANQFKALKKIAFENDTKIAIYIRDFMVKHHPELQDPPSDAQL
jgi:transcriptional regulator with XRE-family HTH domain